MYLPMSTRVWWFRGFIWFLGFMGFIGFVGFVGASRV